MPSRKSKSKGSQPSFSGQRDGTPLQVAWPPWWPMTFDKKPMTYLYRILRPDLDDLNIVGHRARHLEHGGDDFACEVLKALGNGSNERSPFWHASKSLWLAHEWRTKAEASNGVEPGGGKRVAIRIDIWQWYESGKMP